MVKAPTLGTVKTRLAADIGNENALQYHIKLYDQTILQCQSNLWDTVIYASEQTQSFNKYNLEVSIQEKGDLGEKLIHAQRCEFQKYEQICIIGSDCPYISRDEIKEAFESLNQGDDIALGPAQDGGYYLIAMKKDDPTVFENITWSTDEVLNQTIDKIEKRGYSFSLLKILSDVDNLEDLNLWLNKKG
jgi:uncharacterized protein